MAGCMQWGEHGEEEELAPKQRVRRVSDLNFLGRFVARVLEGGIKMCARSITSDMPR